MLKLSQISRQEKNANAVCSLDGEEGGGGDRGRITMTQIADDAKLSFFDTHARTHTRTHTHAHARTHTRTYTRTLSLTHIHTLSLSHTFFLSRPSLFFRIRDDGDCDPRVSCLLSYRYTNNRSSPMSQHYEKNHLNVGRETQSFIN